MHAHPCICMRAKGEGWVHAHRCMRACAQDERSQHKNKAKALKILRARIWEAERLKAAAAASQQRRGLAGSGDRSERIRTYNFPQARTFHSLYWRHSSLMPAGINLALNGMHRPI